MYRVSNSYNNHLDESGPIYYKLLGGGGGGGGIIQIEVLRGLGVGRAIGAYANTLKRVALKGVRQVELGVLQICITQMHFPSISKHFTDSHCAIISVDSSATDRL